MRTKEQRIANKKYNKNHEPHQHTVLEDMDLVDKLVICMPTGSGKSRIIYSDIMNNMIDENKIFAIASHRLLLNSQHLNDLFHVFKEHIGHVGFIIVGSEGFDTKRFQNDPEINSKLAELNLSYTDLFTSSLSTSEITSKSQEHIHNNRDVIIISTYNSLDKLKNLNIDCIYCDEAHFLATPKNTADFKRNFEELTIHKKYFFTATPKELREGNKYDFFLMDNEQEFGKKSGIPFIEAVQERIIVKPIIHFVKIQNRTDDKNYESVENFTDVIIDSFKEHEKQVKKCSANPNLIGAKILVRCPSVEMMWNIKKNLLEKFGDTKIFAAACYQEGESYSYEMNNTKFQNKIDFLNALKDMSSEETAIILNVDILSEGIDVPGITGVLFLSKNPPSKQKIMQVIGRSTRLHSVDRTNLKLGQVDKTEEDLKRFVKPYCFVMLPMISLESDQGCKTIAEMIKRLRDEYGFNPGFTVTIGEDTCITDKLEDLKGLNNIEQKRKFEKIEKLLHEIETLDEFERDFEETEKIEKISSIEDETEWLNEGKKLLYGK